MPYSCRLCGTSDFSPVVDFGSIPIAHRPLASSKDVPVHYPFSLSVCRSCGLVQVDVPIDPEELYRGYNFNVSSWKFEPHLAAELNAIFDRGPIHSAVEIGCNDGTFLDKLRSCGARSVVGIEPNSFTAQRAQERGIPVNVAMVGQQLCRDIVGRNGGPFQLVVARQVIEHVPDLGEFFACIDILLARDGQVFLDLPDFEPSARLGDCSTLWEEHVNYFTASVLRRLLHRHDLVSRRLDKYDFSGGCLAVLAERRPDDYKVKDEEPDLQLAADFTIKAASYRHRLVQALKSIRSNGIPVFLYGSGVRACAVCNILRIGQYIDFALDDQPERQGRYIPGAGIKISAPTELAQGDGALVCLLAVNNENEERVRQRVTTITSRPVFFVSPCAPRDIWVDLTRVENFAERRVF